MPKWVFFFYHVVLGIELSSSVLVAGAFFFFNQATLLAPFNMYKEHKLFSIPTMLLDSKDTENKNYSCINRANNLVMEEDSKLITKRNM